MGATRTQAQPRRRARPRALTRRPDPTVALAILAALGFMAISFWWLSVDRRIPIGDNGKHLRIAFDYLDELRAGHYAAPLYDWTQYPPLVHLVAAAGAALASGDARIGFAIGALNVVFVPLLAVGCYGVGRTVAGPWGGLAAVVFAFGAPMVMSQFHVSMLDAPTTALVAISVLLLIRSERFSRWGYSFGAAVAIAAGFYAKPTFVLFVAGLVVVMLLRGAWRNWKPLLAAGALLLILIEPWYSVHGSKLFGMTEGASAPQPFAWYGSTPYPARFSIGDLGWYGWNLVNNQLYLPLTLFFVVGGVLAIWRCVRHRADVGILPELLGGAVVGWLGVTYISLNDPRYSLPLLVYVASLAALPLAYLGRRLRVGFLVVLLAVALTNTYFQNTGHGPYQTTIVTPWKVSSPIAQWTFTVFASHGYVEGPPERHGGRTPLIELLQRARDDGARQVVFQPESMNNGGFNLDSLVVLARTAGLQVPGFLGSLLGPRDVFVFRLARAQMHKPGCLASPLNDGTDLYMIKGPPTKKSTTYCPPR